MALPIAAAEGENGGGGPRRPAGQEGPRPRPSALGLHHRRVESTPECCLSQCSTVPGTVFPSKVKLSCSPCVPEQSGWPGSRSKEVPVRFLVDSKFQASIFLLVMSMMLRHIQKLQLSLNQIENIVALKAEGVEVQLLLPYNFLEIGDSNRLNVAMNRGVV